MFEDISSKEINSRETDVKIKEDNICDFQNHEMIYKPVWKIGITEMFLHNFKKVKVNNVTLYPYFYFFLG